MNIEGLYNYVFKAHPVEVKTRPIQSKSKRPIQSFTTNSKVFTSLVQEREVVSFVITAAENCYDLFKSTCSEIKDLNERYVLNMMNI